VALVGNTGHARVESCYRRRVAGVICGYARADRPAVLPRDRLSNNQVREAVTREDYPAKAAARDAATQNGA
jgi:hypothetical protein